MIDFWDDLVKILNDPPKLKHAIVLSFVGIIVGIAIGWYRKNIFFFRLLIRRFWNVFSNKKYVLIWNDDREEVSENIIELLKERLPDYKYRILSEPEKLLGFSLKPKYIHIVFLIVSDVTKLAETKSMRDLIQQRLLGYVRKGGNLFGTHDIIYRRCRNTILQGAYGCEIANFKRFSSSIEVKITEGNEEHPLLEGVPNTFNVDDGELCWGEWGNGSKILLNTTSRYKNNLDNKRVFVPTLVIKHTGKIGTFIWCNSADKFQDIARSINEPQPEILKIFENAIKNSNKIKEFDNPIKPTNNRV